ncbi:MAG: DNA/RNA non-specific endonuclease [Isosphaeraceae bacterium]
MDPETTFESWGLDTKITFKYQHNAKVVGQLTEMDLERVKKGDPFEISTNPKKVDEAWVRSYARWKLEKLEKEKPPPRERVTKLVGKARIVAVDAGDLKRKGPLENYDSDELEFVDEDPSGFPRGKVTKTKSMVSIGTFSFQKTTVALLIPQAEAYGATPNTGRDQKNAALGPPTVSAKVRGPFQFDRVPTKLKKQPAKNTAMGGFTAHGYVQLNGDTSKHKFNGKGWEWLHLLGVQLGGPNACENLVAGTFEANSAMIPIENAIKIALKKGFTKITYEISATLHGKTHIGDLITQTVTYKGKAPFSYPVFACRTEAFTSFEAKMLYYGIAEYLELKGTDAKAIEEDPGEDDQEDVGS